MRLLLLSPMETFPVISQSPSCSTFPVLSAYTTSDHFKEEKKKKTSVCMADVNIRIRSLVQNDINRRL